MSGSLEPAEVAEQKERRVLLQGKDTGMQNPAQGVWRPVCEADVQGLEWHANDFSLPRAA